MTPTLTDKHHPEQEPVKPSVPPESSIALEEQLLFGPIGESAYRRYAPALPNDPEYAIKKIRDVYGHREDNANEVVRTERAAFWKLYEGLVTAVAGPTNVPLIEHVYAYLNEESSTAAKQFADLRKLNGAQPREITLAVHLDEITRFASSFLLRDNVLGAPEPLSRYPAMLDDRQAALLAHVGAPLHDALKFLGSRNAQVMPDHEVVTAELLRRVGVGCTVRLGEATTVLTAADVDFLAGVIGNHENIEKDLERTNWSRSPDPVDRARAVFFVADTLTGAIVEPVPGSNRWTIDAQQLEKRFVDLYFRHIDLEHGKIFAPEWGGRAIADLSATLATLSENGALISGVYGEAPPRRTLVEAGLQAIAKARAADTARRDTCTESTAPASGRQAPRLLTDEQLSRIDAAEAHLHSLLRD